MNQLGRTGTSRDVRQGIGGDVTVAAESEGVKDARCYRGDEELGRSVHVVDVDAG